MVDVGSMVGSIAWKSLVINILFGAAIMIIIAAFATLGFIRMKDKKTYIYPVSLISQRQNGAYKRRDDLRGGLVKQRNGVTDFVVKIPKTFKKKKLGFTPDLSLASVDDRLLFITSGDGMVWQQCAEKLITEKRVEVEVEEEGKLVKKEVDVSLIIEPIPTDVKHITINNISQAESILEGNKLKATALVVGGFIIMVIVQVIFLFLTAKR